MQRKLKNWTEEINRNKNKEGTTKPSPKNSVLWIRQTEQVEQQVTPTIQIIIQTHHDGVTQVLVKRERLECVRVGEKLMLRIQKKMWNEKLVNRKRLKYLSVFSHVENVNEETKKSRSEDEDIGTHKCRRRSRVDNINEEVKGWESSSKKQ